MVVLYTIVVIQLCICVAEITSIKRRARNFVAEKKLKTN